MKQDATVELTGGKQLNFETGRIAKQASGAAVVKMGDVVVLGTAVASPEPREGIDFFPLTVDYREYTYAVPASARSSPAAKLIAPSAPYFPKASAMKPR
jgi:polyribonucleotide nucleotidyltransferase